MTETAEIARLTALVSDAFARGQRALANGDRREAIEWLERAHRLAPTESLVSLALASALLAGDTARAALLFKDIVEKTGIRDARLGLIAARFLTGDIAGASQALADALSQQVPRADLAALADRVVKAAGALGWCGFNRDGTVAVHAPASMPVDIRIDGVAFAGIFAQETARTADRVTIVSRGTHLIGSPLYPQAIWRVQGFVEEAADGPRGWVWHPNNPDAEPVLTVETRGYRAAIVLSEPEENIPGLPPLARPRVFAVPWSELPYGQAPVHVRDGNGRDLLGSPLFPDRASPEAMRGRASSPPPAIPPVRRAVVIAIGQPGGGLEPRALACSGERLVIARGDIGTAASEWPDHDLIVLEEGAVPPPGWLARLRDAAYAHPDVGTVTPFSNLGIAAYPGPDATRLSWFGLSPVRLDRLARKANGDRIVELPVAGGPCVFIRRDCFDSAEPGNARQYNHGEYAQGSEQLRALCASTSAAGWQHVALPGLFVAQTIDAVPDAAWTALAARNALLLDRRHPELNGKMDAFGQAGPLAAARRRLDRVRWGTAKIPSAILVTHDDGGGVERQVQESAAGHAANGRRAVIVRPGRLPSGEAGVTIGGAVDRLYPNLTFALPREKHALTRFLRGTRPEAVELHHFLNLDPSAIEAVRALSVAYDVHIHDFIWFCPRIALVGRGGRYCGEPAPSACEACVAETGTYLHEAIPVPALLTRSRAILQNARQVIAPSRDTARRMRRHFPGLPVRVAYHEDDRAVASPPPVPRIAGTVRVCVAGAIGLHKGFHVLLACARNARERGLDLTFTVAGTTIDDQSLLDTGRAFVTGPYRPEEAVNLIRAQNAAMAFLPSIWPETWNLGLTELWRAGLRVAAFDIGAPAERIRKTGRGMLLPLDLPPGEINDAFLNAAKGDLFFRSAALRPTSFSSDATLSK